MVSISCPRTPFLFSQRIQPWHDKIKGSGDEGFSSRSQILGLQLLMYAVVIFLHTVWDCPWWRSIEAGFEKSLSQALGRIYMESLVVSVEQKGVVWSIALLIIVLCF